MKKIMKKLGFVLLCLLIFVSLFIVSFIITGRVITRKVNEPWQTTWDETVGTVYKDQNLNLETQTGYEHYLPKKVKDNNEYSLILYIHGGGFTGGDKASGELLCKYFTSQGYVCASVNYTLADGKHTSNINLMNEQIHQQVVEIKQSAEKYGYNLTQMALTGESAGGCLAMLYAYKEPENSCIPVKLLFQMTGPASFEPEYWGNTDSVTSAQFVSMMTGEEVTKEMIESKTALNLINEISPTAFVKETSVPSIVAYGLKDKVVPVKLKYPLLEAYDENKVSYEYVEFTNSGHAMAFDWNKTKIYADKVNEYLQKYMPN